MITPELITKASEYWANFRKLPIGDAEMIMHLATFANENNNFSQKNIDSLLLLCVEFGYKACEKGDNLQKALCEFKKEVV